MKKLIPALLLFFLISFAVKSDEIQTVKQNYVRLLLSEDSGEKQLIKILEQLPKEQYYSDQMVVELMDRYPISAEQTASVLKNLGAEGMWSDIDYNNEDRSGWQPKKHLENTLVLVKSYRSVSSPYYQSAEVESAVHRALAYWFTARPVSPNWWYNQIGAPKTMSAIALLFEDKLSSVEIDGVIDVLSASKFGMTGQNKVWLAGNVLVRGLLQNDPELVKSARDTIFSEIVTGNMEGIKPDNSFHQHGTQLQFGNYGAAYIASMGLWSQVLAGTSLALEQPQLDILSRLVNDGYSRILWKGYMDMNSLGRQLFRQVQRHKAFSVGFTGNMLMKADNRNAPAYRALLDENFFNPSRLPRLTGVYHFWTSDYTVQRRPRWMGSVRMSSLRVIGGEAGNGDNLKGYYIADGATYTYVKGDEYVNIFPCWDWRKIPGITSYETDAPLKQLQWSGYHNRSNFAGNVNDGKTGITAMDFDRDGLSARKSWIFTDDFILCMGAGVKADSGLVVTTSIEQRVKGQGKLRYLNGNSWQNLSNTDLTGGGEKRFHHDRTGYIVMGDSRVKASEASRTGNWKDIMNTYPDNFSETKDIVSLWIDHGKDPQNGSYIYLILPDKTASQVKGFDSSKIIINNNSRQFQSVTYDGTTYVAAYPLADITVMEGIRLQSTNMGLFMISREENRLKFIVTDPTQQLDSMSITINGIVKDVILPVGDKRGTPVTVYFDAPSSSEK